MQNNLYIYNKMYKKRITNKQTSKKNYSFFKTSEKNYQCQYYINIQ